MRKLIVRCLALALPLAAFANGYDVPNVAPRDLAMVSSGLAAQQDATATYVLPAALARIEGLSLAVGGSLLDLHTTWNSPTTTQTAETKTKLVPPYSVFASYGFKLGDRPVGVGVGSNIVAGGNVFWQDDWPGRSRIITVDRKVYAVYGSAGVEVLKQLRLGGGVVYYRTTEFLELGLEPNLGKAQLSTAGGQWSWDLSAEITPLESIPLTFAIDYKHQAVQNLTGSVHVPPELSGALFDQGVTHVLPYPNVLNLGVAYKVIPPLTLSFVYTFNRYIIYKSDFFHLETQPASSITVPRDYSNGYTLRLGGEYVLNQRLALRAGIERDISGMPKVSGSTLASPTYSPTLPDSDTWAGAVGAGYAIAKNLSVAGTVFYAKMDEVSAAGPIAFPGRYNSNVLLFSFGVTYNWMPGESIGLRKF